MKANELRIGNYLVNFLGQEFQVNIETLRLLDEGGIGCEFPLPNPTPLTKEWLLRFGFERNDLNDEFKLKKFKTNNIYCVFVVRVDYPIHGTVLYGYTNPHQIRFILLCKNLKYVHQFQNWYFASTGFEPEIIN